MSYNVYMMIDTGGVEPAVVHNCGNYTYNVSPMYKMAFSGVQTTHDINGVFGIRIVDELRGWEATPILREAIQLMEDSPATYIKMNPENGWGDYEGALNYLRDILKGCLAHPKATVWVT